MGGDSPDETDSSAPRTPRARADTLVRPIDGERYVELSGIGQGGMGVVSLVHDRQIRRDVALKRLHGSARSNADARSRFAFEARLQGQLEHPAIVPVYDLGEAPDGAPYFTMKRVNGVSLREVLEGLAERDPEIVARWSRRRLLTAFGQLCLAVHYAHEHGVIHRDIKPDNIMLGAYGEVYLLDWGIAKAAHEKEAPTRPSSAAIAGPTAATQDGHVMGTMEYMAPEQARAEPPDPRADVFALGAILFEVLAGEPLRSGDRDAMRKVLKDGGEVHPSRRAPTADIPPELDELVARALAHDPKQRIASALELDLAIEAYLDGDRDLALRRAASARHAETARAAAEHALASDGEHGRRADALHELGKALALDPDNRPALDTLVRLLTTPPQIEPPEVAAAREREQRKRLRQGAIAGGLLYLYVSLNFYTTYLLGIRDWGMVLTAHAMWGAALVASAITIWRPTYIGLVTMFLFGTTASVYCTGVYSPLLMVPGFLTVHATLYSLASHWQIRLFVVVTACVGWTIAVFGERWGLFPDTVHFTGGTVQVSSPAVSLPEVGTTLYLYGAGLGLLILPAVVVSALRRSYERVERQTRLQSWQLQQLVRKDKG